ncbi:Probable protease SohB [Seminavis robusta]|uniref:Probable protease SohB n=1 Tax=Seminavis robusta TaxID=568900 RepID=A0A9N8HEC9_9STRA|nr:Probable protease SohB [Seminavis robusta]|eukprot:Sro299_g111300.1 Probable protease SohB (732) ;mRNA; f:16237-18584
MVRSAVVFLTALLATANGFVTSNTQQVNHHKMAPKPMLSSPFNSNNQLIKKTDPFQSTTTSLAAGPEDIIADPSMSQYLIKLLLEQLIIKGVPTVFTLLVIGFAAFQFRPRKDQDDEEVFGQMMAGEKTKNPAAELYSDLYEGDEDESRNANKSPFSFLRKLGGNKGTPAQTNRGIPALQYIQITNLNQKYDSYDYSLTAATQSKAKAAATLRAKNFDRALRLAVTVGGDNDKSDETATAATITKLSPFAKTTLLELEKEFLKEGVQLLNAIQTSQTDLARAAIDEEMQAMGVDVYELDPDESTTTTGDNTTTTAEKDASNATTTAKTNATTTTTTSSVRVRDMGKKKKRSSDSKSKRESQAKAMTKLVSTQAELAKLETNFIKDVVATLGSERASGLRTALLGDIAARGAGGLLTQLQDRPLSKLLVDAASPSDTDDGPKSLFVTKFPGDVQASQVNELREEVTAIVRNAKPGDEALVILQSGGGTVTGYGLAAAQLMRFKQAGMKLTIAVEQVAASGGYMMCCVADRIISSPFAVLGSIGVISDIPNVYERLKKEGIEFQTVTAGKYKRTITPTKKVTPEDFRKSQQDVEQILVLFKQFVHQNRPSLDIEKVATGETWFGEDALELGLTDEIKTADEVLTEFVDGGWDVFEVEYKPPDEEALAFGGLPRSSDGSNSKGVIGGAVRWLVRTLVDEVKAELGDMDLQQQQSPQRKHMMVDDSADRFRAQDK